MLIFNEIGGIFGWYQWEMGISEWNLVDLDGKWQFMVEIGGFLSGIWLGFGRFECRMPI